MAEDIKSISFNTDRDQVRSKARAVMEVPDFEVNKVAQHNPLDYLSSWDFTVVFMAVFLRFLVQTNLNAYKIEGETGEKFNLKKYLDFKHVTRWAIHFLTSIIGLVILPEIFVTYIYKKYDVALTDWTLLGSAVVGFVGYDLIKVCEKILLLILEKLVGYKPSEK